MANSSEEQWVLGLESRLQSSLQTAAQPGVCVGVGVGDCLTYAHEIMQYDWESDVPTTHRATYETDLLIYDHTPDKKTWIPRVVIECKLSSVTTHDALTYSTKAATHKHVHPYLRYGILIGDLRKCLPPRLARHGAYFDFIAIWQAEEPDEIEWDDLIGVLVQKIEASRMLQELLTDRNRDCKKYRLIHRQLRLQPMIIKPLLPPRTSKTDRDK